MAVFTWLLSKAIGRLANVPGSWAKAKGRLRPRVLPRVNFELDRLGREPGTPHLNLGEHLSVYLVYDRPLVAVEVSGELLEMWQVTFEEAYIQAVKNVRLKLEVKELEPHVYATVGSDSATLLLQPELLKELDVLGDLVIWPMDALFITGSSYPGSLEKIWEVRIAEKELSEHVMDMPLVHRDGIWSEFIPEGSNWQNRASRLLARRYNLQKEPLQAVIAESSDVLVPDALWVSEEEDDANGFTMAVHGPELEEQLLPRCDTIMLINGIEDTASGRQPDFAMLTWEEFEQLMGDRLSPADYFPVRYRAIGCPEIPQTDGALPERFKELARKFFLR